MIAYGAIFVLTILVEYFSIQMTSRILRIHPYDNVAVALEDLKADQMLDLGEDRIRLRDNISIKHKFTLDQLRAGDSIKMYGVTVGRVRTDLAAGSVVNTQNLKHLAQPYSISTAQPAWQPPGNEKWKDKTFQGFHRPTT